jgi:hypothetical protein
MRNLVISFIILAGLLFVGIAIMLEPFAFAPTPAQPGPSSENAVNVRIVPRELILLASALILGGLVGLSIQGFRAFTEINHEKSGSN